MRIRSEHRLLFLILLAAILPNLVWIAMDKTAWPWDQAFYARYSVDLFFTLIHSPSDWPAAMLAGLGRMAPGIGWVGQFFVPVGVLIGSIDSGLLLSIVLAQAVALLLTSVAVWKLSSRGAGIAAAVTGLIVMASASQFIALSHYYLAEMQQTAAVAWFVLIMALAPRWPRSMTGSQLLLATSFAMLAKVSSPAYCLVPGVVALYYLIRPGERHESDVRMKVAVTLAFGVPLAAATAAWYFRNLQTVVAHLAMSSSGSVAELYGKQEQLLLSLKYWLGAVQANFLSTPAMVLAVGVVLAGIVVSIARPQVPDRRFRLAAGVAVLQIAVVLLGLALNANRDNRYLLPLLPYCVVFLCWSVSQLNRRLVTLVVIAIFGFQWGQAHAQALGLMKRNPGTSPWLHAYTSDGRNRQLLGALVLRTCTDPPPGFHWNAVGAQLLWLNPPAISYAAAKELGPRHAVNCDYEAVGYYDNDEDRAWRQLMAKKIVYYIAVDPSVHKTPASAVDITLNQLNEPILKRIERSGLFQPDAGIDGHDGILIFRRVDQIDHVANGRALSDQGKHEQAIDELSKATVLEPANVEAWANLALAYERRGSFEQAVAAGVRARSLSANHYYVNLGLARAFAQLKQWTDAAVRAEDAALDASGVPERVNALTIAGRSRVRAGDSTRGCDLLRKAAGLQGSRELQDELAGNGCGR